MRVEVTSSGGAGAAEGRVAGAGPAAFQAFMWAVVDAALDTAAGPMHREGERKVHCAVPFLLGFEGIVFG